MINETWFERWRTGEALATSLAYKCFWQRYHRFAFSYCRPFLKNEFVLNQVVRTAMDDAFLQLHVAVTMGRQEWKSEAQFDSWCLKCIRSRCVDLLRQELRRRMDILPETIPYEDDDNQRRENLAFQIERLFYVLKHTEMPPVLVETLEAVLEYVKKCLIEAVDSSLTPDSMSIFELIEHIEISAFELDKDEMYDFLMKRLKITRKTLFRRMNRLREFFRQQGFSPFNF